MPYPNEHAARLKEPGQFIRYARKNDQGGKGIDFIIGFRKDGSSDIQAIRFSKDSFTPKEARTWLHNHAFKFIDFEPAGVNASEFAEASKLEDWFEIAKTGEFPQGNLTEQVFDEVVSTFKPEEHEPPIALGHVRSESHNDKPAAGWIAGLQRIGNTLYAKAKQVASDFDAAVREGRFKKRSIGLRTGNDGKLYLHHLAFLGAMAPAVKGLRDIYCEGNYSGVNEETEKKYEFNHSTERILKMEFTEKELEARDAEVAAKAKEAAKKEYDEQVAAEVAKAVEAKTEEIKTEVKAEVEAEIKEKTEAEQAAAAYNSDVEAFLKEYSDGNKLSPAQIAILRPFLKTMNPKTEFEFSEKNEKNEDVVVKRNALKVIRDLFANATVVGGDFADTGKGLKGDEANYSAEKAKAAEFMASDSSLTYGKALVKARAALKTNQK